MEIITNIEYKLTRYGGPIIANIPLPEGFMAKTVDLVYFDPGDKGGNHSHPRTEIFVIKSGSLEIHVKQDDGKVKIHNLEVTENGYQAIVIPPNIPHAVINDSNKPAVMLELSDQAMDPKTTKEVKII